MLLLVASGKTNKVIARALFVSEKTIDRHVSNTSRSRRALASRGDGMGLQNGLGWVEVPIAERAPIG